VRPPLEAPPGVEIVRPRTDNCSMAFVLNHGVKTVDLRLPNPARDLLTGAEHGGELALEPLAVALLEEER
jgi:beta-galactosidase